MSNATWHLKFQAFHDFKIVIGKGPILDPRPACHNVIIDVLLPKAYVEKKMERQIQLMKIGTFSLISN